jgi:hypothetical protein
LFGEQVEQILRENGYRVVEKPVVGDIIVYRNISGAVLHSGLVRSVFDDGAVLIESKWGIGARYLHQPLDQPYGDLFRYYHTDRGNHSVYVVARSDEESPGISGGQLADGSDAGRCEPFIGRGSLVGSMRKSRWQSAAAGPRPGMPANNPMPTRSDVTLGFVPLGFVPPRMPSGMLFPNKNPAGPRSRLPHKTSIQPVPSALHADP